MRSWPAVFALALLPSLATAQETGQLVISEIMYHSAPIGLEELEFIEIYNHTETIVDLAGWYVLDDDDLHPPVGLVGVLAPGEVLVVASDLTLFAQQYPSVTNVNPNTFLAADWRLRNSSDSVRLFNAQDSLVDIVTYCDGLAPDIDRPPTCPEWPTAADGNGPSLELVNPDSDNNVASNWTTGADWGTPGTFDPSPVEPASWARVKSLYR